MVLFDHKVKCGAEYVALRVIDNGEKIEVGGGLVLAENSFANNKLGFYVIEDIGETAEKETGLHVGDYVLADRLAIYYKTEPIGILRYNSIIVKTNSDQSKYWPLRNMCFVEQDRNEIQDLGGIFVKSRKDILNIGTITAMNMDSDLIFPFEVGDKVFLTRCDDFVSFGPKNLYIYKHDNIMCKILDY